MPNRTGFNKQAAGAEWRFFRLYEISYMIDDEGPKEFVAGFCRHSIDEETKRRGLSTQQGVEPDISDVLTWLCNVSYPAAFGGLQYEELGQDRGEAGIKREPRFTLGEMAGE